MRIAQTRILDRSLQRCTLPMLQGRLHMRQCCHRRDHQRRLARQSAICDVKRTHVQLSGYVRAVPADADELRLQPDLDAYRLPQEAVFFHNKQLAAQP